jgi:hypothetical protein
MKRTNRVLFLVAVVSLATTAGSALAQQKSEGTVESGRLEPEYIVSLVANEAVQKDLGVSDDVARKLMSLQRVDYRKAELKAFEDAGIINIQDRMRMMTRERQKYVEITKKVHDDFLPQLKELLTAEQYKRLQQIQFQSRFSFYGPKTLLAPDVAAELKLTDDQKQELDVLSREFGRGDPRPGGPGGGYFFKDGYVKHGEQYRTKAIELLTAEQKEALNKLEGNEFDLSAFVIMSRPPLPRNGNVAAGSATAQQKGTKLGGAVVMPRPDDLWYLIYREAVQKDLGISDDVASKLRSVLDDSRAAIETEYQDASINPQDYPNNMTAEQRLKYREIGKKNIDEFVPKRKELLTADQNKRFQQIQFQWLLSINGPMAILAPDVASELKLTDDQKQKLDTLGREFLQSLPGFNGGGSRTAALKHREEYTTKAIDVLTAEQKETLNKMKGNEIDVSQLASARPTAKGN